MKTLFKNLIEILKRKAPPAYQPEDPGVIPDTPEEAILTKIVNELKRFDCETSRDVYAKWHPSNKTAENQTTVLTVHNSRFNLVCRIALITEKGCLILSRMHLSEREFQKDKSYQLGDPNCFEALINDVGLTLQRM